MIVVEELKDSELVNDTIAATLRYFHLCNML